MHTKTLAQIAQGLRAGDYSSQELTESYLARIKQHQDLNSFITVTEHQAIAAAKQADAVGFKPVMPHSAAGWRIEPPVSVPVAPGIKRAKWAQKLSKCLCLI
jgi:hypothetical protein